MFGGFRPAPSVREPAVRWSAGMRADRVADLGSAGSAAASRAVRAAEDAALHLHAMTENPAPAVLTVLRDGVRSAHEPAPRSAPVLAAQFPATTCDHLLPLREVVLFVPGQADWLSLDRRVIRGRAQRMVWARFEGRHASLCQRRDRSSWSVTRRGGPPGRSR